MSTVRATIRSRLTGNSRVIVLKKSDAGALYCSKEQCNAMLRKLGGERHLETDVSFTVWAQRRDGTEYAYAYMDAE